MKLTILFGYIAALLLASGCTDQQNISSVPEVSDSAIVSTPAESAAETISQQLKDRCGDHIYTMLHNPQ